MKLNKVLKEIKAEFSDAAAEVVLYDINNQEQARIPTQEFIDYVKSGKMVGRLARFPVHAKYIAKAAVGLLDQNRKDVISKFDIARSYDITVDPKSKKIIINPDKTVAQ